MLALTAYAVLFCINDYYSTMTATTGPQISGQTEQWTFYDVSGREIGKAVKR